MYSFLSSDPSSSMVMRLIDHSGTYYCMNAPITNAINPTTIDENLCLSGCYDPILFVTELGHRVFDFILECFEDSITDSTKVSFPWRKGTVNIGLVEIEFAGWTIS